MADGGAFERLPIRGVPGLAADGAPLGRSGPPSGGLGPSGPQSGELGPIEQRPLDERLVTSALECFARYGVSKTTVEDVAQVAGCSRATLYRYFPGKNALLDGVLRAEIRRLAVGLDRVAAAADSLEELAVGVLRFVGDEFQRHDALRHVLAVEPEVVLPHLAFDQGNRIISVGSILLAPHLFRFLVPEEVPAAGEWLARISLNYLCSPSDYVSLADESSVRRLVRTFVLPGLERHEALVAPAGPAA